MNQIRTKPSSLHISPQSIVRTAGNHSVRTEECEPNNGEDTVDIDSDRDDDYLEHDQRFIKADGLLDAKVLLAMILDCGAKTVNFNSKLASRLSANVEQ